MSNTSSALSLEGTPRAAEAEALDAAWVLLATFLVFWEQAGFAMWEAGSLPKRSLHSILLKNMCDAAISAFAFLSFGYAFAFGDGGGFIGHSHFFMTGLSESDYPTWFFQWAFAATAATTVSGCMAERTRFAAYLVYSFVITAFIYPVVVRWLWADPGWLCAWGEDSFEGRGMIDFAGSAVVHMLGGVAGLVGSKIVGPRKGYFSGEVDRSTFRGHSMALTTLGVYVRPRDRSRASVASRASPRASPRLACAPSTNRSRRRRPLTVCAPLSHVCAVLVVRMVWFQCRVHAQAHRWHVEDCRSDLREHGALPRRQHHQRPGA